MTQPIRPRPPPLPPKSPFPPADDVDTAPAIYSAQEYAQVRDDLARVRGERDEFMHRLIALTPSPDPVPPPSPWSVVSKGCGMAGRWVLIATGLVGLGLQVAAEWIPGVAGPLSQAFALILRGLS